jgi:alpha-mannosidase
MARRKIHLICNAHLDPVWLWRWEEGAGEALSTFRAAAGFCEDFDDFVFNHNEAILYRWVEEHEPALFKRIQKLVRKKKWHILGGWHLQPDCNMPSGESFVRQILLGKRYFRKKFGADVKTASNLDPFGHTRGLVQIMAKSGYDSYLFCRPGQVDCALPADEFIWVGFDGSEVMAARAAAHYNSRAGEAKAKVEEWIKNNPSKKLSLLLWGVGNHGGGASRIDLEQLRELRKNTKDVEVVHSTPEVFFKELSREKSRLPRHTDDINPWAVGCYTTMARVKQKHRLLENDLYSAEKMASAAFFQGLMAYPQQEIQEALLDLAFCEFHDILPGSSIPPAEEDALRLMDHGLEILSRVKARAFFALSSGQPAAKEGEIPILVYNPHPFAVRKIIECEFQPSEPNWAGGYWLPKVFSRGKALPSQPEKELSTLSLEWRKKIVFNADLEPGRMNRFDCRLEKLAAKPETTPSPAKEGPLHFKTEDLEISISASTGLVDLLRINGTDFVRADAFAPIIMKDNADPWGMSVKSFRELEGRFSLMPQDEGTKFSGVTERTLPSVRIIEDGDVRTIIEALFSYGRSFICQRYKVPKQGAELEIELRVHWAEKDKMLKLSVPTLFNPATYLGQTACGVQKLPSDGNEAVAQKWVAVVSRKKDLALTVINEGSYGSDFCDGELRLSLLRSPAHSADPSAGRPIISQDRFVPRIDQGERLFRFWVKGGKKQERLAAVDREALAHNEKHFALSFFPSGTGRKPKPACVLSDDAIQVAAFKKAEDGPDLIIRLFEPTGKKRTAVLSLPFVPARTKVQLRPFEIRTLRFDPKTHEFQEVDLLEKPLRKGR